MPDVSKKKMSQSGVADSHNPHRSAANPSQLAPQPAMPEPLSIADVPTAFRARSIAQAETSRFSPRDSSMETFTTARLCV